MCGWVVEHELQCWGLKNQWFELHKLKHDIDALMQSVALKSVPRRQWYRITRSGCTLLMPYRKPNIWYPHQKWYKCKNWEHMETILLTDACRKRFDPPSWASSVAYRSQSEISQCNGLCRCHTFTSASNILALPLIQTNLALSNRIHRRTTSTLIGTDYHFRTANMTYAVPGSFCVSMYT